MKEQKGLRWKRGVALLAFLPLFTGYLSMGPKGSAESKGKDILLDNPQGQFSVDLGTALKSRHSSHDFIDRGLAMKDLSTILWAANGVNRERGKRTAPAPFGKYIIELYVAMDQGVYLYEPDEHKLQYISDQNIKSKVGKQGDIKKASCVLMLVAKAHRLPFIVKKEDRLPMAHATAGCIAQNVYLAANSLKLGTRLVASLNDKIIKEALALKDEETPLYIMPLGYPKE